MLDRIIQRLILTARVALTGRVSLANRDEIPAITPEEVGEAKAFFPLDKFFVFGHARSGTTLLTRLIRRHPDVHCNYQGHFFTREPTMQGLVDRHDVEAWFTRHSNRWNRGRDLSPVVLRAAIDFIMEREARPLGVSVVGDKSPNSLLNGEAVRLMHKLYPDGKLIFIVRDGRDAAVSHRFQTFIDATQHLTRRDWAIRAAFKRKSDPFMRGERSIFTKRGIRTAAEGWAANVTETDRLGREIYGGQYLSLRYEDLLASPWEQMCRLWELLNVDVARQDLRALLDAELDRNPDAKWQQHKAGDLVEPLQKGKTGSWRELFTPRDRDVFDEIAGDALAAWGY
ncbi:MAG: sulfotransferase [Chloroflexota bacterium]|nr:sulfotransferase [Chloroflexota bacterium]